MLQKWIAALENIVIIYGAVVHCVYNTPHQQSMTIEGVYYGTILQSYITEMFYRDSLQSCIVKNYRKS